MRLVILMFQLTVGIGLEQSNYDYFSTGLIIANIKRRELIPLQAGSRRVFSSNSLNYRRTKDIRQEISDHRFEITEGQLREAQREAEMRNAEFNEIREEELKSQIREDMIRKEMHARDKAIRNSQMRQNQLGESINNNYNQINSNYGDKEMPVNKMQREMRWLTIDREDVPEIQTQFMNNRN